MKKVLGVFASLGVLILMGCSNSKELVDYVDIEFSGMDTQGTAYASVDTDKLLKDTLDFDAETDFPDEKQKEEISNIEDAYKIKLDKEDNLSNGDKVKVIVTVNEEKTKKVKSGEKIVEVKGLDEPKKLTNGDVNKHLVVNFSGVSGRGKAKVDNSFDNDLSNINFEIKNNGNLKNGDKAILDITKNFKNSLSDIGYVLDKDFNPTFEITGLNKVAEKATDISNLEDIKRMIDENVKRQYKDGWWSKYEITLNKLMYRQFSKENSNENNGWYSSSESNGNLVGIYTIKEYSDGTDSKLKNTFTSIIGFSDIVLDEKNEVNVADMEEISTTKDDTYSLESVLKLYEGYGYVEVK